MFSLSGVAALHKFPPGTQVSSHSRKNKQIRSTGYSTLPTGVNSTLNVFLTFVQFGELLNVYPRSQPKFS